jgi:hypothetical protein
MPPPPPLGPPPPLCGSAPVVGAMLMPGLMPGAGAVVGPGDGLGIGAALAGPTPNISVDMPTPAAIATALAMRLRSIIFRSLRGCSSSTCWLAVTQLTLKINPATPCNDVAIGLTTCGYGVGPHAARREKTRALSSAAPTVRDQRGTAAGNPASRRRLGGFPPRSARTSSTFQLECPAAARPDPGGRPGLMGAGPTERR